jgi:hypothetical protein
MRGERNYIVEIEKGERDKREAFLSALSRALMIDGARMQTGTYLVMIKRVACPAEYTTDKKETT